MLKDYLHVDVVLLTMPHSTITQMAEVIQVLYTTTQEQMQKFSNITPPTLVIFCNFFDHLACNEQLSKLAKASRNNLDPLSEIASSYVSAMEAATRSLYGALRINSAFVLPPGLSAWPARKRDLALLTIKTASARDLHLEVITATMRIDANSLRPCELSYPAVIADISKYCQTWFEGNSALTVCDATCFDFGMEAAQETFGLDGKAILREPSWHERKAMIGNIWFEKTKTQDEDNPRVPQFPIHLNE
ncbi:MAG: hypothetical protein AAFV95_29425, partial [Bacteroidota bacterium]